MTALLAIFQNNVDVDVSEGDTRLLLQTRELQQAVRPGTRFALVTATLPERVWLDLQALFPDIRMAKYAPMYASLTGNTCCASLSAPPCRARLAGPAGALS